MCRFFQFVVAIVLSMTLMKGVAIGQDYDGAFELLYFGRQPSARAEAMGKSMVAGNAGGFSAYYNPAIIGQNNGFTLSTSYASPYYALPDANYKFVGATYEMSKYGILGLSFYHLDYGLELFVTSPYAPDATNEKYSPAASIYSLTYSNEILKDLHAGVNFNYARQKTSDTFKFYPFDLGLLKIFYFKNKIFQKVTVGASLYNVTDSKTGYNAVLAPPAENIKLTLTLPRTLHFGASYESFFGKSRLNSFELNTVGILLQAEYQDVLNSEFYDGIKAGTELSFIEMICLRVGFYDLDRDDYDLPDLNKGKISDFTYGFGLVLPVSKFTRMKLPLEIKFDMTSLKQPSGNRSFDDFDNFSVYSILINWQPKNQIR